MPFADIETDEFTCDIHEGSEKTYQCRYGEPFERGESFEVDKVELDDVSHSIGYETGESGFPKLEAISGTDRTLQCYFKDLVGGEGIICHEMTEEEMEKPEPKYGRYM